MPKPKKDAQPQPEAKDQPQHDLAKVRLRIDQVQAAEGNSRRGDVEAIARSIAELGQFRTVVVNKGTHTGRPFEVLAGNHTVAALNLLGRDEVDANLIDVDDVTAKKIVLADNRTNDLATYDDVALAEQLEALGVENLVGTGFSETDFEDFIDAALLPPPITVPTTGKGSGKAAIADSVVWGYVTWASTRVLITKDEVEALDEVFKNFTRARGTDVGFGWELAGRAKPSVDPLEAAEVDAQGENGDLA